LVADDSRVDQLLAARLLRRCGHRAEVAENGAEAVVAIQRSRFDAVLMDVEMPELNGIEAVRWVRQTETTGNRIPIIIVSASSDERLCLDSGADAYLSKPLTLERLQAAILALVPHREMNGRECI
jgi:CheY-like chemotaxis protein